MNHDSHPQEGSTDDRSAIGESAMNHDSHQITVEMIDRLKQFMSQDDDESNFSMPSMLKDVPSFTSSETMPTRGEMHFGELGRRSY